jgi:hypothetical protein
MAGGTDRHTQKRRAGKLMESRRCQRVALLAVILGAMPSVPSDGLVRRRSLTHLVTLAEDATIATSLVWRGFCDWVPFRHREMSILRRDECKEHYKL